MTQNIMWREQRRDGRFTWNNGGRGVSYYNIDAVSEYKKGFEDYLVAKIDALEDEVAKLKGERQQITTRNVPPKQRTVADMKHGETGYCTPWSLKYNADGTVRHIPLYVEIDSKPSGTVQAKIKRNWSVGYTVDLSMVRDR